MPSCSSDEEPMQVEDPPFEFEGKWLGRWTDSLFGSVSISAIVNNVGGNRYSGNMFIRNGSNEAYTPGYGGDGTIRFETDGGINVIEFTFVQNAPLYNGGCPGLFEGTGAINETTNRLIINFTGTDCDGFHDEAAFSWEFDE